MNSLPCCFQLLSVFFSPFAFIVGRNRRNVLLKQARVDIFHKQKHVCVFQLLVDVILKAHLRFLQLLILPGLLLLVLQLLKVVGVFKLRSVDLHFGHEVVDLALGFVFFQTDQVRSIQLNHLVFFSHDLFKRLNSNLLELVLLLI